MCMVNLSAAARFILKAGKLAPCLYSYSIIIAFITNICILILSSISDIISFYSILGYISRVGLPGNVMLQVLRY